MRFLDRLSIRVRITLGTVLIAMLFFGAAALITRAVVENVLSNSTASLLEADIAPFETAIDSDPNDAVDVPADGQLVAVIDPAGTVTVSTLPASLWPALGDLRTVLDTPASISVGANHYLVRAKQVAGATGLWTVIAARDESSSDVVLTTMTRGLIIGLGVLVVAFGGLSWLLTGSALRPVSRLRRSAEEIVASGSRELLPVTAARDDVQDLAVTLNKLIESLRIAAARERQMVSDASHELRTPLAVLRAQLDLMREGDEERLDKDIANATAATERLAHLVSDLLELSRLEAAGGADRSATLAQVCDAAGEAIDRARILVSDTDIDIDLVVADDIPWAAEVHVASETVGRILDNLIGNATHAVGRSGRVLAGLAVEGTDLILTVADDGPGIDRDFLPHAFDRFSQPDSARTGASGAGLGLAIVAAAAAAGGGAVTLVNREHGGVLAEVRLPLHHPVDRDGVPGESP